VHLAQQNPEALLHVSLFLVVQKAAFGLNL
jgi:hypothetical protein